MRWFGLCFFVMAVTLSAFAQRADTASGLSAEARVVRLEMGHVCGLCGGPGYRTSLTTVERSFVLREMMDSGDLKKYPNRKERHAITKREWEALLQSIDINALKAVPQDGSCRPCIDLPDSWVVVEYSDGSKIPVHYDPTSEPAAVKGLKLPDFPIMVNQW